MWRRLAQGRCRTRHLAARLNRSDGTEKRKRTRLFFQAVREAARGKGSGSHLASQETRSFPGQVYRLCACRRLAGLRGNFATRSMLASLSVGHLCRAANDERLHLQAYGARLG
jgi:hypothetical protein